MMSYGLILFCLSSSVDLGTFFITKDRNIFFFMLRLLHFSTKAVCFIPLEVSVAMIHIVDVTSHVT